MLEENYDESWRIRIERYIKGKPHGKLIWKSIQNGPIPHPQTTNPAPEGGAVPSPRNKRDEEFTEEDNRNELAYIQAINILSQGLPGPLFDEFKHFRANENELIQDYFVRFHKLVNDMKVTQLDIPTHQLNTKFANNLPSYWGKYIVTKMIQRRASGNIGTKGIQTTGSGVNNTGKKVICYNCHGEGHVARQCKELKCAYDSQWYHDKALLMQAKEKGAVLDAETKAFLADEMHQEEHLNSEVDSVLDYNMITYDEYQNNFGVEAIPTVVLSEKKTLEDKYLKEIVFLTNSNKVATNVLKEEYAIEKKNLLITNECLIANSIANDICSIVLAYDLVVPHSSDSLRCMLEELRTTCDREHSKLKFQKYKECDTSNSTASNAIFEIRKLKEELQGIDDLIRNLQAQNDIMSLLNVRSTDDSCNKHALETELTQLKDTVKKIAAQKAEIATLNAKTIGNKTSGTTKPANPKVIALGMYTISPKYIVPQRRTNRETPIPLPKKKQVTFQETLKPSPRFTQKPVAPLLKKPKVNVPLSTGIKSTTGARKPTFKSNA
uniref:CCHC-type domain-containing protein n=1 Tax=Tanacetum cinerariifolium TaxID=118510 RepID=A0A6L2MP70_TANCI|nr:hypothetical protein [Tanacetum cinerariifolium]